ncbi:hypothetical protein [Rickettsiella endosymbiont of Miltochrista miniata]|uniref:hypothetical protein n=1 Tax=Rickettsiella endosymbiont of Miltochrista miniata TaxID=3066239 RepID=UPI00313C69EC
MIKSILINKFIHAFNTAYSLKPPSITVTDMDEPEKPIELIFTSLASRLAVLHYRQLCDYLSAYTPGLRKKDYREAIRELLKGKDYNPTYFKLFERYYWREWPRTPLVEEITQHILEDTSGIKYLLMLSEEDRDSLQAVINALHICLWLEPPSIFRDKSEKLIDDLQNYLDGYFVFCSEAGITPITSRTSLQYQQIKKEAGEELIQQIQVALSNYQKEIFKLGLISDGEEEKGSLWKNIKLLLYQFLGSIQNLLFPRPPCSNFFKKPSAKPINDLTQLLCDTCENTVLKVC